MSEKEEEIVSNTLSDIAEFMMLLHDHYLKGLDGRNVLGGLLAFLSDAGFLSNDKISICGAENLRLQSMSNSSTKFEYEQFYFWLRNIASMIYQDNDEGGRRALHRLITIGLIPKVLHHNSSLNQRRANVYLEFVNFNALEVFCFCEDFLRLWYCTSVLSGKNNYKSNSSNKQYHLKTKKEVISLNSLWTDLLECEQLMDPETCILQLTIVGLCPTIVNADQIQTFIEFMILLNLSNHHKRRQQSKMRLSFTDFIMVLMFVAKICESRKESIAATDASMRATAASMIQAAAGTYLEMGLDESQLQSKNNSNDLGFDGIYLWLCRQTGFRSCQIAASNDDEDSTSIPTHSNKDIDIANRNICLHLQRTGDYKTDISSALALETERRSGIPATALHRIISASSQEREELPYHALYLAIAAPVVIFSRYTPPKWLQGLFSSNTREILCSRSSGSRGQTILKQVKELWSRCCIDRKLRINKNNIDKRWQHSLVDICVARGMSEHIDEGLLDTALSYTLLTYITTNTTINQKLKKQEQGQSNEIEKNVGLCLESFLELLWVFSHLCFHGVGGSEEDNQKLTHLEHLLGVLLLDTQVTAPVHLKQKSDKVTAEIENAPTTMTNSSQSAVFDSTDITNVSAPVPTSMSASTTLTTSISPAVRDIMILLMHYPIFKEDFVPWEIVQLYRDELQSQTETEQEKDNDGQKRSKTRTHDVMAGILRRFTIRFKQEPMKVADFFANLTWEGKGKRVNGGTVGLDIDNGKKEEIQMRKRKVQSFLSTLFFSYITDDQVMHLLQSNESLLRWEYLNCMRLNRVCNAFTASVTVPAVVLREAFPLKGLEGKKHEETLGVNGSGLALWAYLAAGLRQEVSAVAVSTIQDIFPHNFTFSSFVLFALYCFSGHLFRNQKEGHRPSQEQFLESVKSMMRRFSGHVTALQYSLGIRVMKPFLGSNGNGCLLDALQCQTLFTSCERLFREAVQPRAHASLPPRPPPKFWDAPRFLDFCKFFGLSHISLSASWRCFKVCATLHNQIKNSNKNKSKDTNKSKGKEESNENKDDLKLIHSMDWTYDPVSPLPLAYSMDLLKMLLCVLYGKTPDSKDNEETIAVLISKALLPTAVAVADGLVGSTAHGASGITPTESIAPSLEDITRYGGQRIFHILQDNMSFIESILPSYTMEDVSRALCIERHLSLAVVNVLSTQALHPHSKRRDFRRNKVLLNDAERAELVLRCALHLWLEDLNKGKNTNKTHSKIKGDKNSNNSNSNNGSKDGTEFPEGVWGVDFVTPYIELLKNQHSSAKVTVTTATTVTSNTVQEISSTKEYAADNQGMNKSGFDSSFKTHDKKVDTESRQQQQQQQQQTEVKMKMKVNVIKEDSSNVDMNSLVKDGDECNVQATSFNHTTSHDSLVASIVEPEPDHKYDKYDKPLTIATDRGTIDMTDITDTERNRSNPSKDRLTPISVVRSNSSGSMSSHDHHGMYSPVVRSIMEIDEILQTHTGDGTNNGSAMTGSDVSSFTSLTALLTGHRGDIYTSLPSPRSTVDKDAAPNPNPGTPGSLSALSFSSTSTDTTAIGTGSVGSERDSLSLDGNFNNINNSNSHSNSNSNTNKKSNGDSLMVTIQELLWPPYLTFCSWGDSPNLGRLSGSNLFSLLSKLGILTDRTVLSEVGLLLHQVSVRNTNNKNVTRPYPNLPTDGSFSPVFALMGATGGGVNGQHVLPSLSYEDFVIFLCAFSELLYLGQVTTPLGDTTNNTNTSSSSSSPDLAQEAGAVVTFNLEEEVGRRDTMTRLIRETKDGVLQGKYTRVLAAPGYARQRDGYNTIFSIELLFSLQSIEDQMATVYERFKPNPSATKACIDFGLLREALMRIDGLPRVISEEELLDLIVDVSATPTANKPQKLVREVVFPQFQWIISASAFRVAQDALQKSPNRNYDTDIPSATSEVATALLDSLI